MPITVDFSSIKEFAAIPVDTYPAKVTDVIASKAKDSNNKMLVWTYVITDGKYKGRKLTTNTVLIPESLWVLRNYLEALGTEVPLSVVTFEPKDVIGKVCRIVVGQHKYQGSDRNHIENVLPPVAGQDADEGTKLLEAATKKTEKASKTEKVTEPKPETVNEETPVAEEKPAVAEEVPEEIAEETETEPQAGMTTTDVLSFLK